MRGESSATSPSAAFRHPVDDATKDRLAALAEAVSVPGGADLRGRRRPGDGGRADLAPVPLPRGSGRGRLDGPVSPGRRIRPGVAALLLPLVVDARRRAVPAGRRAQAPREPPAQVDRMLADPRSAEFFRNFVGQWLQARDIETVLINASAVISRDEVPDPEAEKRRARFRELNRKPPEELTDGREEGAAQDPRTFFGSFRRFREFELTRDLRRAMRSETEMLFEHIVREDRSLLELLDCDYTFLNERLAKHYGIDGVQGDEMRRVDPARGQPARRHPDAGDGPGGHVEPRPDLAREARAVHPRQHPGLAARTAAAEHPAAGRGRQEGRRPDPDPAGVAGPAPQRRVVRLVPRPDGPAGAGPRELQRARAMARQGAGRPVDASGKLITGESFKDVRELKQILVDRHRRDFYRCLTEKMLTYALGRGLDAYDVEAVDAIVERIESEDGRASALIAGHRRIRPVPEAPPIDDERIRADPRTRVPAERPNRRDKDPIMTDGTDRRSSRPRRRRQPPPFSPRARRLDRAAGLRVAGRAPPARRGGRRRPGRDGHGRAVAGGLRLLPQRRHPGLLVAERRGDRLPVQADAPAAGAAQGPDPGPRRPEPPDGHGGPDGGGDHARGNGDVPDRRPAEEERHGHPRRDLDRPGDGAPDRPPHAVPVAGAGVRLGPEVRGVRLGVFLRLPVQPRLELADDADAAGGEPAAGLRAALRHRQARRAPGEPGAPPAGAAIDPRLRPRRRPLDAATARVRGRSEARPVPGRGPRDRDADREGRAVRRGPRPASRDARGRPAGLRRIHPAHVRHAGPGVPDRFDAGRDPDARPRRQQPLVRPDRHLRGAPRPVAPPATGRTGSRKSPTSTCGTSASSPGSWRSSRRRRTSTASPCCTTR